MDGRFRRGARLGAVVLLTGVGAGTAGALLVVVLHAVQHLTSGYVAGGAGAQHASAGRRVLALATGGAVVGLGWWALRRWTAPLPAVADAVAGPVAGPVAGADRGRRLPVGTTTADAVLQVVAVGAGASLGREGAPRQVGAALGGVLARRAGLGPDEQRLLVACGAGAGLAAVYDVPLSGALFALEVLLGSAAARQVVPALAASAVAAAVAWPVTGGRPPYAVPPFAVPTPALVVWALLLGPVAGLVGAAFAGLTARARARTPAGWRLPVATTAVFAALGAVAVVQPQVLGNGRAPAELAFTGAVGVPAAAALLVLKPLATAACLRSGAVGGLLTPALATGAVLGVLCAAAWHLALPALPVGSCAVVAAAAVLASTQRAPLLAVALAVELTGGGGTLVLPLAVAVAGAALTARPGAARALPRR